MPCGVCLSRDFLRVPEEEKPCNTTFEYQCANLLCINRRLKCDGYDNCGDRSEELMDVHVCGSRYDKSEIHTPPAYTPTPPRHTLLILQSKMGVSSGELETRSLARVVTVTCAKSSLDLLYIYSSNTNISLFFGGGGARVYALNFLLIGIGPRFNVTLRHFK